MSSDVERSKVCRAWFKHPRWKPGLWLAYLSWCHGCQTCKKDKHADNSCPQKSYKHTSLYVNKTHLSTTYILIQTTRPRYTSMCSIKKLKKTRESRCLSHYDYVTVVKGSEDDLWTRDCCHKNLPHIWVFFILLIEQLLSEGIPDLLTIDKLICRRPWYLQ